MRTGIHHGDRILYNLLNNYSWHVAPIIMQCLTIKLYFSIVQLRGLAFILRGLVPLVLVVWNQVLH